MERLANGKLSWLNVGDLVVFQEHKYLAVAGQVVKVNRKSVVLILAEGCGEVKVELSKIVGKVIPVAPVRDNLNDTHRENGTTDGVPIKACKGCYWASLATAG
jgi:hypothetical protein